MTIQYLPHPDGYPNAIVSFGDECTPAVSIIKGPLFYSVPGESVEAWQGPGFEVMGWLGADELVQYVREASGGDRAVDALEPALRAFVASTETWAEYVASLGDETAPAAPSLYRVTWEIDLEANSPEDAARKAFAIHQDGESTANVFAVTSPNGSSQFVDLQELDEPAQTCAECNRPKDNPGSLCLTCSRKATLLRHPKDRRTKHDLAADGSHARDCARCEAFERDEKGGERTADSHALNCSECGFGIVRVSGQRFSHVDIQDELGFTSAGDLNRACPNPKPDEKGG